MLLNLDRKAPLLTDPSPTSFTKTVVITFKLKNRASVILKHWYI